MRRRVVVTGMSVVTALGNDIPEFWDNICAGKSGVGPLRRFDVSNFKVRFGGEIAEFDPSETISSRDVKRIDRFAQFALVGAHKALETSGIDLTDGDPYRHGVLIGSGIGGLQEIEQQHVKLFYRGPDRVSPFMIPKLIVNAASGNISVRFGLRGPNSAIATACASATNAIGDAFKLIQDDRADIMVTGGSESAITPMGLSGFARMNALSRRNENPQTASRPFDKDRDGFVLSEGAGIVVLEEYERARKRGATIYGEVLGYGMSADASHMTAPDPEGAGASRAMSGALRDARLELDQIDYINAHGTSTPLGDVAETTAIKSVFNSHSKKLCVSSTKSQLGHLLGASGGVEFVVGALALHHQTVPPTINLDNPDPECDLDYVPNEARTTKVRAVLSNSFGFGGHNACLVIGKMD
ncbi:beta-ketoacyl-ACP synthase II [Symmachiella dynata]|uniref:3-oxoacyl-[acyl-carrier-protein] synthase 2 n=1 Tax=Symmachiella dynata TaxID=2527995 RepID=A0A517ZP00_9PLAN|nr:beta-ketoacyl-ACP synthase II [Symmachiella dynata]QDT48593.1 3-oxoacyl-[acyl-carrier-protein] synthase 2 [Symmachiella dynata]QDU44181.1 3-oxoacyl-[acyl-carrier-protein] synthase 2 [Symmachiella dynata]